MQREILIYGIKQGETLEDLLACFPVTDAAADNIERVREAAGADGFHSFRIAGFTPGTVPDFAKTVQA